MREQAVEADGDAEAGQDIDNQEHREVTGMQQPVPGLPHGNREGDDRNPGDQTGDGSVQCLVQHRLDLTHPGRGGLRGRQSHHHGARTLDVRTGLR